MVLSENYVGSWADACISARRRRYSRNGPKKHDYSGSVEATGECRKATPLAYGRIDPEEPSASTVFSLEGAAG